MCGPDAPPARTGVLVAGAGPSGLLLAGELRRRGVDCLLVDALDAPRPWDRATVVHARTLEILEALGLEERLLEQGVRVPEARFRCGGETLGVLDLSRIPSRYGFDLGVSEEVTEAVLLEHLERHGGTVTRGTRLVELRDGPGHVVAELERGGERHRVEADWVVGCDGLHSAVRAFTGIAFDGTDLERPWAVFDAAIEGWDEELDRAVAHLDVPPVIITPLPGGRWRVYLRPTSDTSDLLEDAAATMRRSKPQIRFSGVEHPTRFHCHSRVAEHFRAGRVLLAGDAAHACSPAEGHGMNTGIQDAFNLGWKLALVAGGTCDAVLLDSYEAERRPVAVRIVDSGVAAEAGQALTAAADRAERDATIRATFADAELAHHEAVAAAEIDRSYAGSPIVAGDGAGTRLPDTAPPPLHPLTHRAEHTLLVLGGPGADPDEVGRIAAELQDAHGGSPLVGAAIGRTLDGAAAEQVGVDGITVLAVRPDRYVGLRHDGADPGPAVAAYLDALRG